MTFIYEFDLDILRMQLHAKMKFLDQGFRKREPELERQTDRHDRTYYDTAFAGDSDQNI